MTNMSREIFAAGEFSGLAVLLFQHEASILRADKDGQRFFCFGGCGLRGGGLSSGGLRIGVLVAGGGCTLASARTGWVLIRSCGLSCRSTRCALRTAAHAAAGRLG